MTQVHLHLGELFVDMLSQMLGGVDGTVLAARTAEAEHERGEATVDVALNVGIGQCVDVVKEAQYFTVVLQKLNDGLVQSRQMFVFLIATRIMGTTAVEDIAAAIAALVLGYTFLIAEAEDADGEFRGES